MMKKKVTERVLVLILSIAVLLSSTGVYSVFAETYSDAVSAINSTTESSSSSAADNGNTSQETTTSAKETTTQPNVVTEGGAVESDSLKGTGTEDDPYRISDADDLFKMQDIVNDSSSKDKYFLLTNDIDLSSVSNYDLKSNPVFPGTIVSVDKSKSDAAPNSVKFTFNGNKHKIYGLNVDNTGTDGIAIFGYISAKSTIKHVVFENITVNVMNRKAVVNSAIALYNNGVIRNCEVKRAKINIYDRGNSNIDSKTVNGLALTEATGLVGINAGDILNVEVSKTEIICKADKTNVGTVAGLNQGKIAQVKVSSAIETSYKGTAGGIAGKNNGKVEASTVEVKASVAENTAFGGVAGRNKGIISACVASGKASGSEYAGGIAGKSSGFDSKVKECYAFISTPASSKTGAVVADGEVDYADNVWSSQTSGREKAYADGTAEGNIDNENKYVIVKKGEAKTIYNSSLAGSCKNAKYAFDTSAKVYFDGSGISCEKTNEGIRVTAAQAGRTGTITYTLRVAVDSGYENSSVVSVRNSITVLTFSKADGDGKSEETALEINSGAELRMISKIPYAHFKLGKDITMPENWDSSFCLSGSINGNGHTIYAANPFCESVSGRIKNLDVVLNGKIRTAMFGDAENAEITDVNLTKAAKSENNSFIGLSVKKSGTAAFLNKASGTTIKDCFCNIPVYVGGSGISSVAGFIGTLDDDNIIKSCGVAASITSKNDNKVAKSAAFIGCADKNSLIRNCYATLYSDVVEYVLVGGGNEKIKVENAVYGASSKNAAAAPAKFSNIDAEKWTFESGENGFVTGKGSTVSIALPSGIIDAEKASAKDFKVMFDAKDLLVDRKGIEIKDRIVYIPVEIAKEGSTVRNSSLVFVHKETGLRAEIGISNGLEKDGDGNYLINCGADFTYIDDNFDKFKGKSFIITKDVDMTDVELTSVGGAAGAFEGKIDGKGHTISGIKIDAEAKAALFGTLDGAEIKNITFESAKIKSEGSFAGILAAQIKGKTVIKNVDFINCKVSAEENYAGVLAGEIENSTVKDVKIEDCKINAMKNAGALTAAAESAKVEKVIVDNTTVIGDNSIGVIGEAVDSTVKSVSIENSKLNSKQTAGGIIGAADEIKLSDVAVNKTKISAKSDVLGSAPAAGGICGTLNGTVKNADVKDSKITAQGNAAVAGGIAAVSDNSEIKSADINKKVTVKASVVGGVVGEAAGETAISSSKTFAEIKGSEEATKVIEGAGGIIGRVAADDFDMITISNTNAAGSVSAADYAGGIVGSVLSQKTGEAVISDCVSSAEVSETAHDAEITSGHVIGYVAYLSEEDIAKAVDSVVFSSYSSELGAYGNIDAPETYFDLDSAVESSLSEVIKDEKVVTVKVTNDLAPELGFVFDKDAGWKSDSEKRVEVISSSENKVKLSAEEAGTIAVVGTYMLSADEDIALDVHFDAVTDIEISLDGEGTKESPYIVSNASELEAVSEYAGEKAYFELTNDIDFSADDFKFGGEFYNDGKGFKAIGSKDTPFDGVFNGNGHKISGIVINGAEIGGLFGYTDGAVISDIRVAKADISADTLAAVIAADINNTKVVNVIVSDSAVSAGSAEGSAAAITAYAERSTIENITVSSTDIEACKSDSAYNVACAAAVCARAVGTAINSAEIDSETEVVSGGIAAGIAGYCDKVKISASEAFADVSGRAAASAAGSVQGLLEISDVVAGGKVNADEFAAGIAAKAYAAVKANDVTVSAKIKSSGSSAVVAAYADENVFTDSDDCGVEFSNVIYSGYQNSAEPFASAKINAYQNASYLDSVIDINSVTAKDGKLLVIGEAETDVLKAVKSEYDLSSFSCEKIYSEPENLVVYNKANGTVKAAGTNTDNAKLVIEYINGLAVAVDMISIEGMSGAGTQASPYAIENEETFGLLRIYPDAIFVITNDIKLAEEWTPVDNFTGKLDGAGFEISGLKVNADNAGLFASLGENAEVKNITFRNASVEGKTSAAVVAANVAGSANISGINVVSSTVKAEEYAAAIAGTVQTAGSEFENCTVSDSTVSAKNAGGIAAFISGKAGIKSVKVDGSEISGVEAAGGIAAISSAESLLISKCSVSADISAKNAGGIIGTAEKTTEISDCKVEGTVNGTENEGGIIGYADGNISVKSSKALAELSGKAKNTAEIVAKFASRPEDNEKFAESFADNTIGGEYDEFEPAIMKYQNFAPAKREKKSVPLKGSGTEEEPYIIASAEDLSKIPDSSTDYFVLENDITLTYNDYGISIDKNGDTVYGAFCNGYKPIKDFAGVFDGKNHVIRGLYIDSDSDFVGMFAKVTAAGSVKNLHVELLEASDKFGYSGIKGNDYVGGIVGYCDSTNGIRNCSVTGATISGGSAVGGLAGGIASSKIESSFAESEIIAQNKAGGLVGITNGDSTISNSFTSCKVNAAGGSIVGANNGNLVLKDVMANGTSHGTGAVAIGINNGTIKAERVLIAGANEDKKATILDADEVKYVYSDKTSLRIAENGIKAVATSQLVSAKPEGLENWAQSEGKYPVPVMEDEYSNSKAEIAASPADEISVEASVGNVELNYKLKNRSGDKAMDSALTGVLVKSKANSTTVTSDFFTTCSSESRPTNRILVTTGGFYVDLSLPKGYSFSVKATDSDGFPIAVSDAGSMGWYIESGAEDEVNLDISIVKAEIPWGIFSLWESLAR